MLEALYFIGILIAIFFFLGLCIMIHELGHLLCALWRGLHVERFSIGFGRKIWGFERNGVEYRLSLLPFGGYVALPQLVSGEEPKTEDGQPLPYAKPFDRILTALAGPVSNILLGFALGALVWLVGVERPQIVDELEVYEIQETIQPQGEGEETTEIHTPEYAAGLRPGDRIFEINGRPVEGLESLVTSIALSTGEVRLSLRRESEVLHISYQPKPNPEWEGLGYPFFEVKTPVVILNVVPKSPADEAGLAVGDRILAVGREPIHNSYHFIQAVGAAAGDPVSVTVERDGQELEFADLRGRRQEEAGETRYVIGVQPGQPMETRHLTPWWQFKNVLTTTRDTLSALVSRDSLVAPRHMSGPVGILQMQYMTIRYRGWRQGLFFVVFISFSLAIFNLLPVPVLDGGHIVAGGLEMVVRRRPPPRLAWIVQAVFAVLLIGFMLYVTLHDLDRLTRPLRESLRQEQSTEEATEPEDAAVYPDSEVED